MTDVHTTVYIDSGRKNAMYTLRQSRTGGQFMIDHYLRNLSTDPEKAEAKARAWFDRVYGERVDQRLYHYEGFADFELNERGAPSQWERGQLRMIEEGVMPFGKNEGKKFSDLDDGYILWWAKESAGNKVAEALVAAMKALAEERGLYAKEREEEKRREAERERTQATADVPVTDERIQVAGEVVGIKMVEGFNYNSPDVKKIVVLDDRGFKVYGTCPNSIAAAERGDHVSFMSKIETSDDDSQFGFFKRPSKATLVYSEDLDE